MGRIKSKGYWGVLEMAEEMRSKPYLLNMGKNKLARRYYTDSSIVGEARKIVRGEFKKQTNNKKFPKILIFDIETTPLEAYIWQKEVWKAHVGNDKLISNWFVLSWAAKWLFDEEVMSDRLNGQEATSENDERIIKSLWKLFDEADIVIAHNGGNFDIPNMNTRFIVHGLMPPSSYQMIDTLKIARRQFGFTHNSLNALAGVFGIESKIETTFDLWKRCKYGDDEALEEMVVYNRKDVTILEEIYLKIRPWIKSHPNIGLFMDSNVHRCPNCGSEVVKDGKYYYTMTGKYETYKCTNKACGAISRSRSNSYDKDKRKHLVASVAR